MLSTKHNGNIVGSGKKDFVSKEEVMKPDVIIEYNVTMGGVDNLCRVMDPYSCQRKTLKWYRKIAELFIDISIFNAYVVWKELNSSNETHLGFRQKLCTEIITFHSYRTPNNSRGPQNHQQPMRLVEKHFIRKISQVPKKQKRRCVWYNLLGERRETKKSM